jgi:hypothetical protein
MTSLSLVLWIVLGIALQLAIYLATVFWRHWQDYQGLRSRGELPSRPKAQPQGGTESAAWTGFRSFKVARKVCEDADQSVCSFYLEPEDGAALPVFRPGQFLTFRLDLSTAAGGTEPVIRCYSLSDAPGADGYRVSIKRVLAPAGSALPPGRSSNYFHDRVAVGSQLEVRAPSGHFYLARGEAPVVLIAGGIGITPLLSMVNWCLAEQPGREIWLFYGVRNGRELIMKSRLEAMTASLPNFHLHLCFSQPRPEDVAGRDYQHRGRMDVALLRQELALKPYECYLCGPGPLLESLVPALEDWGVPASRIHFEAFGPSSIKRKDGPETSPVQDEAAASLVVNFARSGRQLLWRPGAGNLLAFAEENGIAVPSGCRAGGCGTCQTSIGSGEVVYGQPPDFDPEPGTCLLCVSSPKSSVTLEA